MAHLYVHVTVSTPNHVADESNLGQVYELYTDPLIRFRSAEKRYFFQGAWAIEINLYQARARQGER